MIPRAIVIGEHEMSALPAIRLFLNGRLAERETIDWALKLGPRALVQRQAILDLLKYPEDQKLPEPWLATWRLIEESWLNPVTTNELSAADHRAKMRLKQGDRSGTLIAAITELVAPKLEITPRGLGSAPHSRKRPKVPDDLVFTQLTSGKCLDPVELGVNDVGDVPFLIALASALDHAVDYGLDVVRRSGGEDWRQNWQLGELRRAYYVSPGELHAELNEPDAFRNGIAPSVKLLHAVVARLIDLDLAAAFRFLQLWSLKASPIHLRLWAALARDTRIIPAEDVAAWLLSLDDRQFWNVHAFPEIAELRARRFKQFSQSDQSKLVARILKRPPSIHWSRKVDADRVESYRTWEAVQELRRIEIAGSPLPIKGESWLRSRIGQYSDLVQMDRIDQGFPEMRRARWVSRAPDRQFDIIAGVERLRALEAALGMARQGWDDDPAERAHEWIREGSNTTLILSDLENAEDGGGAFPRIWGAFGWAHTPKGPEQGLPPTDVARRVLGLLEKLPLETARKAIEGICGWMSSWEQDLLAVDGWSAIWEKLWPLAVEVTNSPRDKAPTTAPSDDGRNDVPDGGRVLNSTVGKLVGIFLATCPRIAPGDHPFEANDGLRHLRDIMMSATGQAGLIVRHRLIEHLGYFLLADPEWAETLLVKPLSEDSPEALFHWEAVARKVRSAQELELIGDWMADRATNPRFSRKIREILVLNLVVECLYAYWDKRQPKVGRGRVQQTIRLLDDEVRGYAANSVTRFIRDAFAAKDSAKERPSAEDLFRSAVKPFLEEVWPQERSLATPGVSAAFADLPAKVREAFAEAVDVVERFLVPFKCWSLLEYGLFGDEDGEAKLTMIDDKRKAEAFLKLLDLTVGRSEDSVIPHELGKALDQIETAAPPLARDPRFLRLATAARRP